RHNKWRLGRFLLGIAQIERSVDGISERKLCREWAVGKRRDLFPKPDPYPCLKEDDPENLQLALAERLRREMHRSLVRRVRDPDGKMRKLLTALPFDYKPSGGLRLRGTAQTSGPRSY